MADRGAIVAPVSSSLARDHKDHAKRGLDGNVWRAEANAGTRRVGRSDRETWAARQRDVRDDWWLERLGGTCHASHGLTREETQMSVELILSS